MHGHRFDHGIEQQPRGRPFDLRLRSVALDQKRAGRGDLCNRVGVQVSRLVQDPLPFPIDLIVGRADFDFPKHRFGHSSSPCVASF